MATLYDMRTGNSAGIAARTAAGAGVVHAHFNLRLGELAALTQKSPDDFMLGLFGRSTILHGPMWYVSGAVLPAPTPSGFDWQAVCQLVTNQDLALLRNAPTIQWLDAVVDDPDRGMYEPVFHRL